MQSFNQIKSLIGFGCALSLALGLAGALGYAAAQQTTGDTGNGGAGAAAPDQTAEEQIAFGQSVVTEGHSLNRRVSLMLDEARRGTDPDIIRVPCLDEVLNEVDMRLKTALERFDNLKEAIASNDADRRKAEYLMLTVIKQKFQVLSQRANQCIGKDVYETGAARVVTTVQPTMPGLNATTVPTAPPSIVAPVIPPPASPVM